MKNKIRICIIAVILAVLMMLSMTAPIVAHAAEENEYGNAWVYDESKVVSDETEAYIASLNEDTFAYYQNKPQLAFIIIDTLPYNMDSYKLDMFNEYGVGTKEENHGMLFVFAIKDREYGLEIGDGFAKGSLLRKDLETDFITEEMKNSLRNEDYDSVVRQVTDHLAKLMADEEQGVYIQKQAEAAAAEAKLKEDMKTFFTWVLWIICGGLVIATLYFIAKAVYDHIKKKKAIAAMLEKYSKQIGWFGEHSDEVVKHVVDRFKGHDAEYVKRQFGDYLHDCYLIQMMARLVKIGNVNHQSKYMEECRRVNDLYAFERGNVTDPAMIVYQVDADIQKRAETLDANTKLVKEFFEKNDYRIENRAIVSKVKTCFTKFYSETRLYTEGELNRHLDETMERLNFEWELDRFIAENADKIDHKDFDRDDFYRELKSTNNYKQYRYRSNYNNFWMQHYLLLHMATQRKNRIRREEEQRRAEERRREQARRHAQQQRTNNSSFGTSFGGGFSSGGGFKGGW